MAAALTQLYTIVAQDPEIRQSVGLDQVLGVINEIGQMLGLPRDFKLQKINEAGGPDQQADQMAAVAEEIKGAILQEVGDAIEPIAKGTQENANAIDQIVQLMKSGPVPPQETQYDNTVPSPAGIPAGAGNPELAQV